MQECDHLYGVTMEEKGISKVMSLDIKPTQTDKTKHKKVNPVSV